MATIIMSAEKVIEACENVINHIKAEQNRRDEVQINNAILVKRGIFKKYYFTREQAIKNPATTHALSGVTDPDFKVMPGLLQAMLVQIWMAHPDNRTKYMILDPNNWDKMPASIIDREVEVTPVGLNHRSLGSGKLVGAEQW